MRISDWSSDVCSSDLAEEDLRDLLAAELRPILLQESGRTGDRRCCEAVTADGDNVAILVDGIYAPGCNRQRPVGECAGNAIAGNRCQASVETETAEDPVLVGKVSADPVMLEPVGFRAFFQICSATCWARVG